MPASLIMHTQNKIVIHVEIKKTDIKLASTFCNATHIFLLLVYVYVLKDILFFLTSHFS